ncbi:hypothetical protein SBDP1_580012 [Syntrophobacter sp. SbD1]|nr:hypothetical protein SBDP1_580012 [Syntrophobacter sp. SbD1]
MYTDYPPDYIDIHEVTCLPNDKVNLTPNPMGSAG